MAKQKGPQKLSGTIDDLTHYKTKDGHLTREKGGVDKSKIQTNTAYERTRENMTEFSEAGKAGRLIRHVFRALLKNMADGRVTSRMQKVLSQVVKSDLVSDRGQRKVSEGDITLLKGFEFNASANLSTTLYAPYTTTLDRATGQVSVAIPAFVPDRMVSAPFSATHFRIISSAAEIDFVNSTFVATEQNSAELPLGTTATEAINLQNTLTANTQLPLFLVMGIEFYQEVNGKIYLLRDKGYNALSLVLADKVVTPP